MSSLAHWTHAAQRLALDSHEDDGTIRHRHRPLGEPQSVCHCSDGRHVLLCSRRRIALIILCTMCSHGRRGSVHVYLVEHQRGTTVCCRDSHDGREILGRPDQSLWAVSPGASRQAACWSAGNDEGSAVNGSPIQTKPSPWASCATCLNVSSRHTASSNAASRPQARVKRLFVTPLSHRSRAVTAANTASNHPAASAVTTGAAGIPLSPRPASWLT